MMSKVSGRYMPLSDHIRQSIADILFTRIGSRVQREEYGSLLPELIDQPLNEATRLRVAAATLLIRQLNIEMFMQHTSPSDL